MANVVARAYNWDQGRSSWSGDQGTKLPPLEGDSFSAFGRLMKAAKFALLG